MNSTYYLSANTSGGYVSFFDECIKSVRKIIVLKNATRVGKERLFKKILGILDASDIDYDKIIRCGTSDETDAIILNEFSTVIADESLFSNPLPLYADIIDFADHIRLDYEIQNELLNINNKIDALVKRMYRHLNQAKIIHDEWEKIYISNIDYDKINEASDNLIKSIFDGLPKKDEAFRYQNHNRFLGSLLSRGSINYIEELTADVAKRIYIKGRPGTGKSTFLKKVISKAKEYNYSTETYYCSFDSSSLDMVIIREIGIAIFDSTSPHEIFPTRDTDEVFDIYEIAVNKDTDLIYAGELMQISSEYNQEIKKAKECLYTCNAYYQRRDSIIYDENITDNCINRIIALSSLN